MLCEFAFRCEPVHKSITLVDSYQIITLRPFSSQLYIISLLSEDHTRATATKFDLVLKVT